MRGTLFNDYEAACRARAVVALAIFEPSLDALVPEYVLAWQSDRLMGGAKRLAADYAFLDGRQECVEVSLHYRRWGFAMINRQGKR